jgi:stress response protein YsnF
LREEYKVGKREVTQNESVSDNVRRERLLIDDAGVKTSD